SPPRATWPSRRTANTVVACTRSLMRCLLAAVYTATPYPVLAAFVGAPAPGTRRRLDAAWGQLFGGGGRLRVTAAVIRAEPLLLAAPPAPLDHQLAATRAAGV